MHFSSRIGVRDRDSALGYRIHALFISNRCTRSGQRAWLPDSCTFHIEAVHQIGNRNIRVSDKISRVIDRGKVRENLMQNI